MVLSWTASRPSHQWRGSLAWIHLPVAELLRQPFLQLNNIRFRCCTKEFSHKISLHPFCFISGVCSADLSLDMGLVDQGRPLAPEGSGAEPVQGCPW